MLIAGIIAGPLYVIVSLIEILSRDGFDPGRHAWSQLANGDWGWVHSANLIVSGLLIMLAARRWDRARALIALYGLGMVVAGVFKADPGRGFPAGTPETVPISTSGLIHLAAGGVGFICVIIACLLLRRRTVGILFALAYIGVIAGGGAAWSLLLFTAAVIMISGWITFESARIRKARNKREVVR